MKLYSRVCVAETGQTGTVIEKGEREGKTLYLVEIDGIEQCENLDDGLLTCTENELEVILNELRER